MASNHALRGESYAGKGYSARYEPNDGNLAATGGSQIVCFWYKHDSGYDLQTAIRTRDSSTWVWSFKRSGNDIVADAPGMTLLTWTDGYDVAGDGEWHFVILQADYTGGAGNGILRLWVDGQVRAELTGRTWNAPATWNCLAVGTDTYGKYAMGLIDGFCIFDGYATDEELATLWNGGDGVKPVTDDHIANATLTFRAGFDKNSAVADYAAGTAAPTAGKYGFKNGFWFGQDTGFEKTTCGPADPYWTSNGERLYSAQVIDGQQYGYEDWSTWRGAYSDEDGFFRVTADSTDNDLQVVAKLFRLKWPHQVHLRLRTHGLAADEYVRLKVVASEPPYDRRFWLIDFYPGKVVGRFGGYDIDLALDTTEMVDVKLSAVLPVLGGLTAKVQVLLNDEHELPVHQGLTDHTDAVPGTLTIQTMAAVTAGAYVDVASLGLHGPMQPVLKTTAGDTFPDEDHLLVKSDAARQTYDEETEHPWTDEGLVWEAQAGTWSHTAVYASHSLFDAEGDKLQIWAGGIHNETPWPVESGLYKYNIGYGELDLSSWPTVGSVAQGDLVYRAPTPYLYAWPGGVIDTHDGRRLLMVTQYQLPDSPNFVGQCRGKTYVGQLTDDTTLVLLNEGRPIISPVKAPSFADTQIGGAQPVYNPGAARGQRYQMYAQCYGDRNTWDDGDPWEARALFCAMGDTPEGMKLWTSGTAMLPLAGEVESCYPSLRWEDDYTFQYVVHGGSRTPITSRSRAPTLITPGQLWEQFYYLTPFKHMELIADHGRGVWHCPFSYANEIRYAHMRLEGFDWIGLDSGETSGYVETVDIQRPSAGWGSLRVNVDADAAGQKIEVALIDPDTGDEIAGWGQAECDDVTVDDTDTEVTWVGGARKLSQRTDDTLRLRFHLARTQAGDATPRLYSYRTAEWPGADAAATTEALRERVWVGFAQYDIDGQQTRTNPAAITSVTTHRASDDSVVETLGGLTWFGIGLYYAQVTLSRYSASKQYYLKVVYEMVSGRSQTTKKHFWVKLATGGAGGSVVVVADEDLVV